MRILIVEDEVTMAEAMANILQKNNFTVDLAHDGETGLDCALSDVYDTIILDVMLPKRDGFSIVKEIRKNKQTVPVLMLTAKGETDDKVCGLDSGADDYLTKPFKMDELLARLRALSRRKGEIKPSLLQSYGDIEYNPHTLTVYCKSNSYKLTLKEGQLLMMLIEYKTESLSKNRIIERLWGYDSEIDEHSVEVYISFLRKKLQKFNSSVSIGNVRGIGYRLTFEE